jgi:hypothetical protein
MKTWNVDFDCPGYGSVDFFYAKELVLSHALEDLLGEDWVKGADWRHVFESDWFHLQGPVKCRLSLKVANQWDLGLLLSDELCEVVSVANLEEIPKEFDLLLVLTDY